MHERGAASTTGCAAFLFHLEEEEMDPNEALATARAAVQQVRSAQDADEEYEASTDLADAFAALDEWLTKGGFLPKAWAPPLWAVTDSPAAGDRAAHRLETAFDRVLRDDEQLDRAFLKDGEEIHHLRGRLIRLLAREVVAEAARERQLLERTLASAATQQFTDELRRQLEGP